MQTAISPPSKPATNPIHNAIGLGVLLVAGYSLHWSPESLPWDPLGALPLVIPYVLTSIGLVQSIRLLLRRSARPRTAALIVGVVTLATNPITAPAVVDWFRPKGEITASNWREHRSLQAAAAADVLSGKQRDPHVTEERRRFRCADGEAWRALYRDSRGRDRAYDGENTRWYFDEAGTVRLVHVMNENLHLFLDAGGRPLWAWRRRDMEPLETGLALVRPSLLSLPTAKDARLRFAAPLPAGCQERR